MEPVNGKEKEVDSKDEKGHKGEEGHGDGGHGDGGHGDGGHGHKPPVVPPPHKVHPPRTFGN